MIKVEETWLSGHPILPRIVRPKENQIAANLATFLEVPRCLRKDSVIISDIIDDFVVVYFLDALNLWSSDLRSKLEGEILGNDLYFDKLVGNLFGGNYITEKSSIFLFCDPDKFFDRAQKRSIDIISYNGISLNNAYEKLKNRDFF
jgi:hypothetical protein